MKRHISSSKNRDPEYYDRGSKRRQRGLWLSLHPGFSALAGGGDHEPLAPGHYCLAAEFIEIPVSPVSPDVLQLGLRS